MLYSGSLDLILIAKPYKTENLNVELIKKDFFHVALPGNSPLLKKAKKKSLNNKCTTSHPLPSTLCTVAATPV